MHPHATSAVIGFAAAAIAVVTGNLIVSKPRPVIVHPQTVITAPANPTDDQTAAATRKALSAWGNLTQAEVNKLSSLLALIEHKPLTIFCWRNDLCGDMQLDFDNAFETAHWDTKLETPLVDDTIGVATSDPKLRDAINKATDGRLEVGMIAKTAPYEVLVIGRKKTKLTALQPWWFNAPISGRQLVADLARLEEEVDGLKAPLHYSITFHGTGGGGSDCFLKATDATIMPPIAGC